MSAVIVVRVAMYGILRDVVQERFDIVLDKGSKVSDLVSAIGLTENDVGMIVIQGRAVDGGCLLSDGDQVDIFPPLSGG